MNSNKSLSLLPYDVVSLIYEYDGRYSKLKQYFYEIVLPSVKYVCYLKQEIQIVELQIEERLKIEDRAYFASNWKRLKRCSKIIKECRDDLNELYCELNSILDKKILLLNTYDYLRRNKYDDNHFTTKEYELWLNFGAYANTKLFIDAYNNFLHSKYCIGKPVRLIFS